MHRGIPKDAKERIPGSCLPTVLNRPARPRTLKEAFRSSRMSVITRTQHGDPTPYSVLDLLVQKYLRCLLRALAETQRNTVKVKSFNEEKIYV